MSDELREAAAAIVTDAPTTASVWSESDKDRFTGYVEKWRGLMLLNSHHINVAFCENPSSDSPDTTCASIWTNEPYMSGHHIDIFPRMLKCTVDEQERKTLHELAHIITNPTKELARRLMGDKFVTLKELENENERATDWIANIAWALYDKEQPK